MAGSWSNGNPITFIDGVWRYSDNMEIADNPRKCPKCGRVPTDNGHDACLGNIPGVFAACCGHGVYRGYKVLRSGGLKRPLDDVDIIAYVIFRIEDIEQWLLWKNKGKTKNGKCVISPRPWYWRMLMWRWGLCQYMGIKSA
jgi:hypothetical protein